MANFIKWLGVGLGWSFGGPIGAFIGYVLGNVFDNFSQKDLENFTKNAKGSGTTSGDFEISLLILSSVVLKADGEIDEKELDFVRKSFVEMYGKERANSAFRLFSQINQNQNKIDLQAICRQIAQQTTAETKLQLLHYLFGLANADGRVCEKEVAKIEEIADHLGVFKTDYISIKSMFYDDTESYYKILGLSKDASETEIKKAYRTMVKKHHPDKVKHLGEEHFKGAEQKFIKIQEAYEKIKTQRNF